MKKLFKTIKCKKCGKKFKVPAYYKKVSYCADCFEKEMSKIKVGVK